jgi:hypothetical protein
MPRMPRMPHRREAPSSSVVGDLDGLFRTGACSCLRLLSKILSRGLVQYVKDVVIADLEQLWCGLHAERIALAEDTINQDAHATLLSRQVIAAGAASSLTHLRPTVARDLDVDDLRGGCEQSWHLLHRRFEVGRGDVGVS